VTFSLEVTVRRESNPGGGAVDMPVSISKQTHTHVHTLTQGLDASEMMRILMTF